MFAGSDCSSEHDGIHSDFALAAGFRTGLILSSSREGGDLGSALGIAGEVLSGIGLRTQSTDAGPPPGALTAVAVKALRADGQ